MVVHFYASLCTINITICEQKIAQVYLVTCVLRSSFNCSFQVAGIPGDIPPLLIKLRLIDTIFVRSLV